MCSTEHRERLPLYAVHQCVPHPLNTTQGLPPHPGLGIYFPNSYGVLYAKPSLPSPAPSLPSHPVLFLGSPLSSGAWHPSDPSSLGGLCKTLSVVPLSFPPKAFPSLPPCPYYSLLQRQLSVVMANEIAVISLDGKQLESRHLPKPGGL